MVRKTPEVASLLPVVVRELVRVPVLVELALAELVLGLHRVGHLHHGITQAGRNAVYGGDYLT